MQVRAEVARLEGLIARAAYLCDHESTHDDCELCAEARAIKARQGA